jgi:hypothetical protein
VIRVDEKRTSAEKLESMLRIVAKYTVKRDWVKTANNHTAQVVLDTELGKYTDKVPTYQLDQETRDRLLAHARQDAAEALLNTRSLLDELHRLKKFQQIGALVIIAACVLWVWWGH